MIYLKPLIQFLEYSKSFKKVAVIIWHLSKETPVCPADNYGRDIPSLIPGCPARHGECSRLARGII